MSEFGPLQYEESHHEFARIIGESFPLQYLIPKFAGKVDGKSLSARIENNPDHLFRKDDFLSCALLFGTTDPQSASVVAGFLRKFREQGLRNSERYANGEITDRLTVVGHNIQMPQESNNEFERNKASKLDQQARGGKDARVTKKIEIENVNADVRQMPFPDGSIDLVVGGFIINSLNEHDYQPFLLELHRVLKEDGVVLLNVLVGENKSSHISAKKQYELGFDYTTASARKYRALFNENNFEVQICNRESYLVVKRCKLGPIVEIVLTKRKEGEPPKNVF